MSFSDPSKTFSLDILCTKSPAHLPHGPTERLSNKITPKVSILVSNGGYGTVQQALSKGVPMILAGVSQDKAQTGPIAEYVGVGIYLPVEQTTADMVREAVDEMLTNPRFGNRARELKERYRQYDPVRIVDETVQEVVGKIHGL